MDRWGRRLCGERSVNPVALTALLLIVGSTCAGLVSLYRLQLARQAEALRAEVVLAEQAHEGKKLEKLLEQLLQIAPRDPEALDQYGRYLAAKATTRRQKARALKVLDRAVRENPEKAPLRQALVELALLPDFDDLCNPDPHLEVLRAALPKSAVPCMQLAARAIERGEFARAERLLREGVERDRNHLATRLELARLWRRRLGREAEAMALATGVDPNSLCASERLALADYWRDAGEDAKRRAALAGALAAFPNDPEVLLAAAASFTEQACGAPFAKREPWRTRAQDVLMKGIAVAPRRVEFYIRLAYLHADARRPDEAFAVIRKGLIASPRSVELRWVECELLLAAGGPAELERAAVLLNELRGLNPGHAYVRFLELRLDFARRRFVDVARGLEQSLPLLADNPALNAQGLLLLAAAYRELGAPVLQESTYRRLLAIQPLNGDACIGLGEALVAQQRHDDAVAQLAPIRERLPRAAQVRLDAVLAAALVRREVEKPPSHRQWKPVDQLLDDVFKADPFDQSALDVRVERLTADGRLEDALAAVEEALNEAAGRTAPPDNRRSLFLANTYRVKALLLIKKNDIAQARATIGEARRAVGDCAAVRLAEAAVECRSGLPKDGAVWDRLVVGTDALRVEDRRALLQGLAALRHQLGDGRGAMALYRQAALVDPLNQPVQRSRFLLALDAGDLEQSREAAAALKVVGAGPGSPAACAQFLLDLHRFEAAPDPQELRRKAVDLVGHERYDHTWVGVPYAVARNAELSGRTREAIAGYSRAFDAKAPSAAVARRLVRLTHLIGDDAAARRWLLHADLQTADPPTLKAAASAALAFGDVDLAKESAARVAARDRSNVDESLWAAAVLDAAGAFADAEALLRSVAAAAPQQPRPYAALVDFLARRGRSNDARQVLESTNNLPRSSRAVVQARFEESVGNFSAAQTLVDGVVNEFPDDYAALRFATEFRLRRAELPGLLDAATRLTHADAPAPSGREWAMRVRRLALAAAGSSDEAARDQATAMPNDRTVETPGAKYDARARALVLALQPSSRGRRDALKELTRLERLGASDPFDQLVAAQIEQSLGRWDDAKRRLTTLTDGPAGAPALAILVRGMLANTEPPTQIEARLTPLEAMAPKDPETIFLRAALLSRSNSRAAADHLARQVERGAVDDLAAGAMLAALDNATAAETFLRKAMGDVSTVQTERRRAAATLLVRVVARAGKIEEALAICQSLRDQLPPGRYADLWIESLDGVEALPEKSVKEFSEWLSVRLAANPKDYDLLLAAACVESRQGRYARAVELLQRLTAEAPTDHPIVSSAVNNLAYLLTLADDKPAAAMELLARQIAATPTPYELRDTLALILLRQNKLAEAIAELEELALLAPSGSVFFHLAQGYARKGDLGQARSAFEKARALNFRAADLHALERPFYDELTAQLHR